MTRWRAARENGCQMERNRAGTRRGIKLRSLASQQQSTHREDRGCVGWRYDISRDCTLRFSSTHLDGLACRSPVGDAWLSLPVRFPSALPNHPGSFSFLVCLFSFFIPVLFSLFPRRRVRREREKVDRGRGAGEERPTATTDARKGSSEARSGRVRMRVAFVARAAAVSRADLEMRRYVWERTTSALRETKKKTSKSESRKALGLRQHGAVDTSRRAAMLHRPLIAASSGEAGARHLAKESGS